MNIKPSQIEQEGFTLVATLNHQELIPFIQENLKKKNRASRSYTMANILSLTLLVGLFVYHYIEDLHSIGEGLMQMCYGVSIAFLLIPLHEYIHALAYRYVGARETSYDANWRKFYFMAMADKFVTSRSEFIKVALAPFVIISTTCLLLIFILPVFWWYTLFGILATHTACCSGDFGLLSYFEANKDKEIITYDDKAKKESYFFERERKG